MKGSFYKIYDFLFDVWRSVEWTSLLLLLKTISLTLITLLILASIYLLYKIRKEIKRSLVMVMASATGPDLPPSMISQQWEEIWNKIEQGDEDSFKQAVMDADKIFDNVLKKIGYQGEDMGERLKQITPAQLANINELWQAHKVRNQIAHDVDFRLTKEQAKQAVEIYQRALQDLEAL